MPQFRFIFIASSFFCLGSFSSFGQLGIDLNIEKPKTYEDRVLRAEKSGEKKFTVPRRFFQNTTTHYNYFFNANNKLNEVISLAKAQHRDDFSSLLPFYNYSLDATAANKIQLDSIIIKSQTGLVLHDLRSDWADNLYLLWGAAYYLRKDFDSAQITFQFINYAFADKEKDGYYRYIGSRMDGNAANQIATKEDRNLKDKIFTQPPSRNDAFIWQIRTHLAKNDFTAAATLIEALKLDPQFPSRLKPALDEVQALSFYKQQIWDSAAFYLDKALVHADNKQERARWEFLAAQLYELSGNVDAAADLYDKAINRTTDPVLEIYARLNAIKTNRDSSTNTIEQNIEQLRKMARRDRYQDYRNIIYYMAAQMEMERQQPEAAYALLLQGIRSNDGNNALLNKIFLQLAEMSFQKKEYRQAYNFYDSLRLNDPTLTDLESINSRKTLLGQLAGHLEVIERQDSLQALASLPEAERDAMIRDMVRQLRKAQGLKDNEDFNSTGFAGATPSNDIFAGQQSRGDWYFYNASLRKQGEVDFKNRWGNRPNADNWRRSSAIRTSTGVGTTNPITGNAPANTTTQPVQEISYDALLNNLPLTPEKLGISNDSIQRSLFALGTLYLNGLDDCGSMAEAYGRLMQRHPLFNKMDEVLFNLYYCYQKNGNKAEAEQVKQRLASAYPNSRLTTIALTGKNPAITSANPEATAAYEKIYDQFIEGNFSEALARKKVADSIYGDGYWTPQQMYIESVYYIQNREDSLATLILNNISSRHPNSPIADKARHLAEVLSRRAQIEAELTNLQIERPAEDTLQVEQVFRVTRPEVQDTAMVKAVEQPKITTPQVTKTTIDTVARKPVIVKEAGYTFYTQQPHMAMIILHKVDPVFINEARTAMTRYNREKYYNQSFQLTTIPLDSEYQVLVVGPFADAKAAVDYVDRAKPITSTQIMPWLKADKYQYIIISQPNLEHLQTEADINKYKQFLEQHMPGMF